MSLLLSNDFGELHAEDLPRTVKQVRALFAIRRFSGIATPGGDLGHRKGREGLIVPTNTLDTLGRLSLVKRNGPHYAITTTGRLACEWLLAQDL